MQRIEIFNQRFYEQTGSTLGTYSNVKLHFHYQATHPRHIQTDQQIDHNLLGDLTHSCPGHGYGY